MEKYYSEHKEKMRLKNKIAYAKNATHNAEKAREYRVKNREAIAAQKSKRWRENLIENRARQRERRFGLPAGAYAKMMTAQNGRCAICGDERTLVVDHNHDTGAVRALLCSPCNTALGLLKESPKRILAALDYLDNHNRTAQQKAMLIKARAVEAQKAPQMMPGGGPA